MKINKMSKEETKKLRDAAIEKIRAQFGDAPEHKLIFAMLKRAIKDLFVPRERADALCYLKGDMQYVEMCGVNPGWVRRVLKECGIII